MPENTTRIEMLENQGAMRTLDALQAKATQLEQTLQRLSSSLGSGAGGNTEFRSAARELSATQGSIAALQASATPGNQQAGGPSVSQAVMGGAQAGARAFGQIDPRLGPSVIIQAAQQAGQQAGQQWMPAFNPQGFAAGLAIPQAQPLPAPPTLMQQMQMMAYSPQMRGAFQPLAGGGGMAFAQGLDLSTQLALRGGDDPMGRGRVLATILGTVLGAGAGFATGNPLIGMGIGVGASALIGHVSDWFNAPQQIRNEGLTAMTPLMGVSSGTPGGMSASGRFMRMDHIREMFRGADALRPTAAQAAQAWETLSSGLAAGGIDPYQRSGGYIYSLPPGRFAAMAEGRYQSGEGFGGSLMIGTTIENAIRAIRLAGVGREQTGEMYTRRLTQIYGNLAPEMAATVAPIFGTLPETGGNMADILMQYGPEATARFLRIQNDDLVPERRLGDLMHDSAVIRGAGREARRGALRSRGSGAAMLSARQNEMSAIEGIPGGRESLAYAESFAQARDAERMAFEQEGVSEFEIPSARLEAAREIMAAMPYAPGNRMALGLGRISLNRMQRGRLQGFLQQRRASGSLSEAEELETTQRILGLEVSEARNLATLTEGMDEMLPALSAGRPAFGARLDSGQLAAMRLFQIGHPRRGQGAISGRQVQMQDDFVRSFGIDPREVASRSMRGMVDNPALAGMSSGRIEHLLEQILYSLQGNGPIRSQRPGEAAGRLSGQLSPSRPARWDEGYN